MSTAFLRAACASPQVSVADCAANARAIIDTVLEAERRGISLLVFPELSVTSYTCGDLFLQQPLLQGAAEALSVIAQETAATSVLFFVGLPLVKDGALYNCAAAVQRGTVKAVIPKTFIPNYSEFYEKRWFTPAPLLVFYLLTSHFRRLLSRLKSVKISGCRFLHRPGTRLPAHLL